uniref:CRISPR-associated helicase Cas3 n=1 Tax=candidate division WOR-3 bacterium TaxID=2052148 RepID=A0A7V3ZWF0_UNCW3
MAEIWAKSKGTTLKDHITCMLRLIDSGEFERVLDKIECKLSRHDFNKREILKYASLCHDFGKVSPNFQRVVGNLDYEKFFETAHFPDVRHNILSLFFINKDKLKEYCKDDEILYSTFLSAIAFHHWRKDEKEYIFHLNEKLVKTSRILLENGNGLKLADILRDHLQGLEENGVGVRDWIAFDEDLARHIQSEGNLISAGVIPPYSLYFLPERLKANAKIDLNLWVFLSGFLMRLDHLASFLEIENTCYVQMETALKFEKEPPQVDLEGVYSITFGSDFWQKKLKEHLSENVILIAPTGIGKTEFSFLWACGEKFFYSMPLRVATNQIFDRASKYFNSETINEEERDPWIDGNVGLLHSDADLYIIEKFETLRNTNWDGETPRIIEISRLFSLPIIVSTGDQIFPSALKYPGYEKVYATLGYSKLIIDEVQAYDPRACAIVVKMIEDMVSLGGKFLLMTATLPNFVIEELDARGIDYVLVNLYDGTITRQGNEERAPVKIKDLLRHKIEVREKDIEEDVDEIIKKANKMKRVLVVLNTVEKAVRVFERIKEKGFNGYLEVLHSRLTLNERRRKEKELETEFSNPKPMDEKKAKILVATQVVEASLDIDADYLFTEIAPMDSIVQRMGRVMRRVDLISGNVKGSSKPFQYDDFYDGAENNVILCVGGNDKTYPESGRGHVYPLDLIEETLRKILNVNDEDTKKSKKKGSKSQGWKEIMSVAKERSLELSECDKNRLVVSVFSSLSIKKSRYYEKFYETLKVLDAGYVSENKEEAHKIFREIYTIPIVSSEQIDEIVEKVKSNLDKLNWTWFKKEIIAEYVIYENMWRYREYNLKSFWKYVESRFEEVEVKVKKRLESYLAGIYVVEKESAVIV